MSYSRTVIILGSSRGDGNTANVVRYLQSVSDFNLINLLDYNISYYDYEHQNQEDDYLPLMEKLIEDYDTFVLATPVYWYTMSAQLKTFLDRFSDLLRIRKELGRKLRGKNMALISCGYSEKIIDGFSLPVIQTSSYLGMNYLGDVYTWSGDHQELSDIVKDRIEHFAETITSKMISNE